MAFPCKFDEPIEAGHEFSLRCIMVVLISVQAVVTECSENVAGKIWTPPFQIYSMRVLPIIQTKIAAEHCVCTDRIYDLLD